QAYADALVARHLPSCPRCRRTLEQFDDVAGELALAVPARRTPSTLDARVRRGIRARPRRRRVGTLLTACALLGAAGLGLWSVNMTGRIARAEHQQAQTAELISAVTVPNSR